MPSLRGRVLGEGGHMGAVVLSTFSQVVQPASSAELQREQRLKLGALYRTQQDHGLWSQVGTRARETAEEERERKREVRETQRDSWRNGG